MKKIIYPKWINEHKRAKYKAFRGMVPISWGPINAVSLIASLNGTFLSKIYQAIKKIKKQKYPLEKVTKSFSCPSSLRVALHWLILEYQNTRPKDKEQFKEIAEFFVEVLKHLTKKDIFAYRSNIVHSQKEINGILSYIRWNSGNKESAKELGKLYNSLSSLVFSLYGDFFPQDSDEIYGPYDASKKFGKKTILLIKHFPKIKCVDLWPDSPEIKKLKFKDVKIYQVFKNVQFQCETVGMHSIYKGDLISNLIAYAVVVDGKYKNNLSEIKKLSDYFAKIAFKQSLVYENMSKKDLKKKVLEWECYQFLNFFKLAKMNWLPTGEMIKAIKNKKVSDRFRLKNFPSYRQYILSPKFEIYWLKDLYK